MPNSNSPNTRRLRQKNAARWVAAQKSAGAVRVTVLLPPESAARLARLASQHGGKTAAVIAALERCELPATATSRVQTFQPSPSDLTA